MKAQHCTLSNHFSHVEDVTKAKLYWLLMSTDWREDRIELEHSPSLPASFVKACLPAHIYWETWLPADPGMPGRELAVTISAYWWQICLVLLSVLLFMGRTDFLPSSCSVSMEKRLWQTHNARVLFIVFHFLAFVSSQLCCRMPFTSHWSPKLILTTWSPDQTSD